VTLNLVLVAREVIHVAADFRLSQVDATGSNSVLSDHSPKVIEGHLPSASYLITYTGVGSFAGRETHEYVAGWLVEDRPSTPAELSACLARRGSAWLKRVGRQHRRHTFVVALVFRMRRGAQLMMISNFQRADGRSFENGLDAGLIETTISARRPRLVVTGQAQAVDRATRRTLRALAGNRTAHELVRNELAHVIREISNDMGSKGTVGQACYAKTLTRFGGEGRLYGSPDGPLVPQIMPEIMGMMSDFLKRLGPKARIISSVTFTPEHQHQPPREMPMRIVQSRGERFRMSILPGEFRQSIAKAAVKDAVGGWVHRSAGIEAALWRLVRDEWEIELLGFQGCVTGVAQATFFGYQSDATGAGRGIILCRDGSKVVLPTLGGNASAVKALRLGFSCKLGSAEPARELSGEVWEQLSRAPLVAVGTSSSSPDPRSPRNAGFIWSEETGIQKLSALGCPLTEVEGMTPSSEIVGHMERDGVLRVALWAISHGVRVLEGCGGRVRLRSVGPDGTVVGTNTPYSGASRSVIWDNHQRFLDWNLPEDVEISAAIGERAVGVRVESDYRRPVLIERGTIHDLPHVEHFHTEPEAFSLDGLIVGVARMDQSYAAVVWHDLALPQRVS
jgi:hypothetical protein